MEVTIIGTGNMARGIGSRVLAGGHELTVVGKDSKHAAADLGGEGTLGTGFGSALAIVASGVPR